MHYSNTAATSTTPPNITHIPQAYPPPFSASNTVIEIAVPGATQSTRANTPAKSVLTPSCRKIAAPSFAMAAMPEPVSPAGSA